MNITIQNSKVLYLLFIFALFTLQACTGYSTNARTASAREFCNTARAAEKAAKTNKMAKANVGGSKS